MKYITVEGTKGHRCSRNWKAIEATMVEEESTMLFNRRDNLCGRFSKRSSLTAFSLGVGAYGNGGKNIFPVGRFREPLKLFAVPALWTGSE